MKIISQSFSNNTSSKTSAILGIVFGVIGIGIMIISVWIGLMIVVLGVVIFLLMRYFANDTTISCHENGFTVTIINKRKGTTVHDYTWKDVTQTIYYEQESGGEDSTTTCYFQANTENGIAFNLAKMKNFDKLIQIFNQKTSHLPYIWEKPKGMFKTSYKKQNRISS